MLKSISVHSYYRIYSYRGTSDKININTTSLLNLFGYFDYPGAGSEKHVFMLTFFIKTCFSERSPSKERFSHVVLIDGKSYCKIKMDNRRYGLKAEEPLLFAK